MRGRWLRFKMGLAPIFPISNGKALAHGQAFEARGDHKDQANENCYQHAEHYSDDA
jgi:hypothetical protein